MQPFWYFPFTNACKEDSPNDLLLTAVVGMKSTDVSGTTVAGSVPVDELMTVTVDTNSKMESLNLIFI